MTWNVENLFPPGSPIGDSKAVKETEYRAKLEFLSRTILQVTPDVLAMQEIGGSDAASQALNDLQMTLLGQYPFKAISRYPDARGIRVAFLARVPIVGFTDIVNFAPGELSFAPNWYPNPPITRMGRGALEIEVELAPGLRVHVLTLHLKSKLIQYPAAEGKSRFTPRNENERTAGAGLAQIRRTAEAAAVRTYLNKKMLQKDVQHMIVTGDLNDEPRAATTQMLLGPEDADATSDDQLDPVRLYNLVDAIPMRGGANNDHYFLPPEQRYSRIYQGHNELIDHILVSKSLLGSSAEMRANQWRVQEVCIRTNDIQGQSISDYPSVRANEPHPDHAAVFARFQLP
jgi:endonuclease/exonuclease/phosphatase family metal-dependent hydrolase